MERITISSSLKHTEKIREVIIRLGEIGVVALFPNLDGQVAKENVTLDLLRELENAHFDAIDQSEGIYVICPEGKVGTLVTVEVGYAKKGNKTIIFSEKPDDLGLQVLASRYVSLDQIEELKNLVVK